MKTSAFSLIELMVVIAIVAVLAALAVPAYKNYVIKTQVVKGVEILHKMKEKLLSEYEKTGSVPNDFYYGGIQVSHNTLRPVGVSNVVLAVYWPMSSPNLFLLCANVDRLDGIPGYVAPTTSAQGLRNRVCVTVSESVAGNGVYNTKCGAWNYSAGSVDAEIDPKFLPGGCSCSNINLNQC